MLKCAQVIVVTSDCPTQANPKVRMNLRSPTPLNLALTLDMTKCLTAKMEAYRVPI